MNLPTVSILGCGWLGLPLAKKLIDHGHNIKGSVTRKEKLRELAENGIEPYVLCCDPKLQGKHQGQFFQSRILFLNIPFRRNLDNPEWYLNQIHSVSECVSSSSIDWVIFTSSTSVYPDDIGRADEQTHFLPTNDRSRVLAQIEQDLLTHRDFDATILRLSGLYGPNRTIGKIIGNGIIKRSAESNVNLVHQYDCVGLIARVVQLNLRNMILNICSDKHPTRRDLYNHIAETHNKPAPEFSPHARKTNKIVLNNKIKGLTGYQFAFPDPITS